MWVVDFELCNVAQEISPPDDESRFVAIVDAKALTGNGAASDWVAICWYMFIYLGLVSPSKGLCCRSGQTGAKPRVLRADQD